MLVCLRFVCLFAVYPFVCSLVRIYVDMFVCLFVCSCVRLFVRLLALLVCWCSLEVAI